MPSLLSRSGNEFIAKQGTAVMKKNPASVPEPRKNSTAKVRRTSKTDVETAPASTRRKPLLDAAVDSVKKMLKSKSGSKKSAAKEPQVEVEAPTVVRRSYTRPKKAEILDVPPILLEGDAPADAPSAGPAKNIPSAPRRPRRIFPAANCPKATAPKNYFLTARDPHWLYAHWDLTRAQQDALNAESTDGHLILRIFAGKIEGHPAYEIHVHPESRHWFAHVERAGNSYAAELGYYSALGKWMRVAFPAARSRRPTRRPRKMPRNSRPSRLNFRSPPHADHRGRRARQRPAGASHRGIAPRRSS
jgi:hypothetical protein